MKNGIELRHAMAADGGLLGLELGFYRHLGIHLACETRIPDLIEQHGFPTIYRTVRDV